MTGLRAAVVFEDEHRAIQAANHEFCEMFGIEAPPAALVGFDCAAALDETAKIFADPAAAVREITGLLARRTQQLGATVRLADGRILERDYVPVVVDGYYRGHLWRYRDMTEAVRNQEALVERGNQLAAANAELARAARMKDEFLAAMSHELRTPLNSILSLAEALRVGAFGELPLEQDDALRMIDEGGRFLLQVINDVLDVSKVEAGRLELAIAETEVEHLVRAVVRLNREAAQQKGSELEVEVAESARFLWADPLRLKQMLTNLVSNALKFTERGGRAGVRVWTDPETLWAHVAVWDTGTGIAPEDLPRLFQPFVQLDARLSRAHAGTGLGLALVHRLARLHGGRVDVESAPGKGTTFTICLPPAVGTLPDESPRAPQSDPTRVAPPPSHRVAPLVLIADDNEVVVKVMERFLSFRGYRVSVARNGREAVDRVAALQPDLVMMDIQMPGMDGFEAIQQIRADPAGTVIPIIALTALAMPGDRERCLRAGATEYLSKPVPFERLIATVAGLLGG
ncbi:MAG: response regulator [Myxococcales bacterium]|nr:response regulator [Myxococcales bacterium]